MTRVAVGPLPRRRLALPSPVAAKPLQPARRSRSKRWNDALVEMIAVQAECAAWFEALRDSVTETALQELIDLDLDSYRRGTAAAWLWP
ncbi:MAG: hypothetical protein ACREFP_15965 [Acetobacteraceae bacterium]